MKGFAQAALSLAVFLVVLFAALAIPVWWLESRFGSISAIATVGGFIGVMVFAGGAWLAMRIQSHTLNTGADFVDAINHTQQAQVNVWREYARGENAQQIAQSKIAVIDYQYQLQQQQQAQRMLTVARQQWDMEQQQAQPVQAWPAEDTADAAGARYYDE
jgi:energy-coupling factor transporter transmembrane protein EcfT